MRVEPKPWIGVSIGVGYAVLFLVLEAAAGVDYDDVGKTTDTVVEGIVGPLAIATLVVAGVTTGLGWWRPALFERHRSGPPWLMAVPVLLFVAVLAGINWADFGELGTEYLVWLAVGTAMVGFSEEMAYRGLSLTGLRAGWDEVWVWLCSSVLFGLLHGMNLFLGQDAGPTVQQVGMAFVIGSVFYCVRRVTGTLIVPMVLHALWDFGSFSHAGEAVSATSEASAATGGQGLQMTLLLVAVVLCVVASKHLFSARPSDADPA